MARSSAQQRLTLPSRLAEVSRVERAVLDAATEYGYEGADRFAIKLALEEALANAIKHGNRADPQKQVEVQFSIDAERAQITVCDQGPGFDAGQVPDPTLDENLEKPYGRGVMLMRTYMSEVQFNETGNCVTLTKRRTCRQAVEE